MLTDEHVELDVLDRSCRRHLSAGVRRTLFRGGYFSDVFGVQLSDGQSVVVKARPAAARLSGCFAVHEHVFKRGFPCPEPLVGPSRTTPAASRPPRRTCRRRTAPPARAPQRSCWPS